MLKRLLILSLLVLSVTFAYADDAAEMPETNKDIKKEILNFESLRERLKHYKWDFLTSDEKTTVITAQGRSQFYIRNFLRDFCESKGGEFSLLTKRHDGFIDRIVKEKPVLTFRDDESLACRGGEHPFTVKAYSPVYVVVTHNPEKPLYSFRFLNSDSLEEASGCCGFLKTAKKTSDGYYQGTMEISSPTEYFFAFAIITRLFYFCVNNGGEYEKDGEPFGVYFKRWIEHDGFIRATSSGFNGIYGCKSRTSPFTASFRGSGRKYTYTVKHGYDESLMPEKKSASQTSADQSINQLKDTLKPIEKLANVDTMTLNSQHASTIEESLALETTVKKTTLFKVIGMQEFTGIYNGKDYEGCELATVEKVWDPTLPKPRVDTLNYRICNGMITKIEGSVPEKLPKDIETYIKRVAAIAQKHGTAEMQYQRYMIKAESVRDKNLCLVQVKIFDGIKLVHQQILDGCR